MHPIVTPKQIGAALVARRKKLELSQTQLAGKLGLSQNRLSELENAPQSLTVEQLLALLNLLGLELTIADRAPSKSKSEW